MGQQARAPRAAERAPRLDGLPPLEEEAPRSVATAYGRRDYLTRRLLALADMLGISLALVLAATVASGRTDMAGYLLAGALTLPLWVALFKAYGLYDRDIKRISHTTLDDVPWLFHALVIGSLLIWAYYKLLPVHQLVFAEVVAFAVIGMSAVLLLRSAARRLAARLLGPERVLIVGVEAASLLGKMRKHPEYGLDPIGVMSRSAGRGHALALPSVGLPHESELDDVVAHHGIDRIVVSRTDVDDDTMLELLRRCKQLYVKVSILPELFDVMGPSVEVDDLEGVTVLGINPPVLSRSSRLMKRGLDVIVSALLLLLVAPLMALIALAIKLDSRGPAFFRQERIGKAGRRFRLVKFRTMTPDAESLTRELRALSEDPSWLKLEHDPRITRVGRFLRLTSLDELPQLWNVLRGEMSLVGPRPLIEAEDSQVDGWDRSRLELTPGVTGLWQVLGRTDIPFAEMVKLDYLYVTNWSLWYDIRLICRTLPAVLSRRGAN